MSNKDLKNLNENELEKALEITLSEKTPSEEIVKSVTPWRKAMTMALLGIAFTLLTPNLFYLNYILPAIGIPLLFFGFRRLRNDSKEFKACYIISTVKVFCCIFNLFYNSTIYASGDCGSAADIALLCLSLLCSLTLIIALTLAIRKTQLKADLPVKLKGPVAMIILYIVLLILALLGMAVPIIGWVIIISYIAILVNLHKVIKSIDTAGYVIESAPSKALDKVIGIFLLVVTVASIACGYLFFHDYDMQWKEFSQSEHAEVSEIKENLKNLGFPEKVLNDMSAEDIEACKNAVNVYSESEEWSVDESIDILGFKVNPDDPETNEIRFTHVVVLLDKERNEFRYIHYFEWINGDDFYGTEAIQIWHNYGAEWIDYDSFIGKVLYTENGRTFASPYYSFGNESYENDDAILGGLYTEAFARFSFPSGNLKQRGYVSYVGGPNSKTFTGSWINYNHQKTWLQYPVTSAAISRQKDLSYDNGAFIVVDDIFLFHTETKEFD